MTLEFVTMASFAIAVVYMVVFLAIRKCEAVAERDEEVAVEMELEEPEYPPVVKTVKARFTHLSYDSEPSTLGRYWWTATCEVDKGSGEMFRMSSNFMSGSDPKSNAADVAEEARKRFERALRMEGIALSPDSDMSQPEVGEIRPAGVRVLLD